MKVLLVGEKKKGSMAWFIERALLKMGVQVTFFDHRGKVLMPLWKKALFEGRRFRTYFFKRDLLEILPYMKRASKELLRTAQDFEPDLTLITKGETLPREIVRELRDSSKLGVVNWFPDNPFYDPLVIEALEEYDLFYVKDPYIIEELKKLGATNIRYLPHACDPEVHKEIELTPEQQAYYGSDISFVGTMYPYRLKILEQLSHYDLKIWGGHRDRIPPWSSLNSCHMNREVVGWEQAAVFNASSINLNTHHPNDIEGVNQRVFDIAGSGGFQLVDHKKGIELVFSLQNEIVTYRSLEELKELIEHFLSNPIERKAIAKRAMDRAHREHTYTIRLEEIFHSIEVKHETKSPVFA